jgi:hypothetical protein
MAEQPSQPDVDRTAELLLILLTGDLFEEWMTLVYYPWLIQQQMMSLTWMTQFWFEIQEWAEDAESSLVDWPYIVTSLQGNVTIPVSLLN